MRFTFHGAAREVGRSCIQVSGSRSLLLDCGIKLTPEKSEYPVGFEEVDPADISAVMLSHAHLDHMGALPWLDHRGVECPIFASQTTKALTKIMLKDAFKVGTLQHEDLGYTPEDIRKVLRCVSRVKTDGRGEFKGLPYRFFEAGHIPGSSSIYFELDGKKILYTGDIKTSETRLMKAADTKFPEVDVLICESTYGDRDHPPRSRVEQDFLRKTHDAIDSGQSVLIPVFALGRSQEILLMLSSEKLGVPIYLDGMANLASDIMMENPSSVRDSAALGKALSKAVRVKRPSDRGAALRSQSIIVTTSGMLSGGPVMTYLDKVAERKDFSILVTGYQVEGTNGYSLLNSRTVDVEGESRKVACDLAQFDFSAHAGMSELKSLVRSVAPKKVVFVHGDEKPLLAMHEWAEALGFESYAPKLGDVLDI